jgi:hypothetical protein
LRELHIDSIEPIGGTAPSGSKVDQIFTLGSFLIALAPELVKEALSLIVDWLRSDPSRTIKIRSTAGGPEYQITGRWKAADLAGIMKILAKRDARDGAAS